MNKIYFAALSILLTACAHHPADCAIGVPWSDCLEGTAGYKNGGGSETRENALKLEMAKKESSTHSVTDRLKELDALHKNGVINDSEYEAKKQEILKSL